MFDIHHNHIHKTECEKEFEMHTELSKQLLELEAFKRAINKLISDFIKTIEDKLKQQDLKIHNTRLEFNENLEETTVRIFETVKIEQVYNGETEAMDLVLMVGGED